MSDITAESILPEGTRVWVFEPMISLDRICGTIMGWNINTEGGEMYLTYQVDFGDEFIAWVSDFQITGWLRLVA